MARLRRASWVFGFGVLIGVVVWRFYGLAPTERAAGKSTGNPEPLPADDRPEPAPEPAAPVPPVEPSTDTPAPPDPVEAAPEASTAEAPDDLSADALAAADLALDQEADQPAVEPVVAEAGSEQVKTLADVKRLVDQGRIDPAIAGLRRLRRQDPSNPQLPFMMGELYFKRGWWSDGLAKYREAVRMRSGLKERSSIQKDAIEALGADKTYARARALIVRDIGRPIATRLRSAARSHPSETVRRRAKSVLRQLF